MGYAHHMNENMHRIYANLREFVLIRVNSLLFTEEWIG